MVGCEIVKASVGREVRDNLSRGAENVLFGLPSQSGYSCPVELQPGTMIL